MAWNGKLTTSKVIKLNDFIKNFNSFAKSKPSERVFELISKSMLEVVKKMYSTRAYFRTGLISLQLKDELKATKRTFHMGIVPLDIESAFHYQETGFTSRAGRWIPGRFFFKSITQDVKKQFQDLAKKVFEDVLKKMLDNGGKISDSQIRLIMLKHQTELENKNAIKNNIIKSKNIRRHGETTTKRKRSSRPGRGSPSAGAKRRLETRNRTQKLYKKINIIKLLQKHAK